MASASTLLQLLATAAASAAGATTGLRFVDRREAATLLTWRELHRRAAEVGAALQKLGVGRGERVGLVYPTGPEFFFGFFGALAAAAVPVPLYPPVRLGRLDEYHERTAAMLRAASARLVLADRTVGRLLGESIEHARPALGCRTLDDLPPNSGLPVGTLVSPDELALVQFSSGTTVAPKPVALSHRAILAQVRALNALWPAVPGGQQRGVSWLPLYHDMGLIGCVFPALALITDLTLIGPEVFVTRPAVWLRAISRYQATISPAPNFAYGLCVEKIRDEELAGVDLSSWRVALNGAEAVSGHTARAFIERFSRWGFRPEAMTPVYGLSEAALAVSFSFITRPFRSGTYARSTLAPGEIAVPEPNGTEVVSVGQPLPGFEIEVRDDAGLPCQERQVGRIWIRGPSLMTGYLDQPEATAKALVAGWLDSGDLGFVADDELYLTGRAKDLVILRGRNYPPEEIERCLDGAPGVRVGCTAATSWLPDQGEREELVVFVEAARDAGEPVRAALPETVRAAVLAATGLPVDQVVVAEPGTLPRTSSGKIRRGETLRLWLAGALEAPAPVSALRLAAAFARSTFAHRRARKQARSDDGAGTR
ncbi:MAG: AMP-binding protein [Thermoanaerobaculia bacterium]|nr:AMP-binding protein [Thermoanaerobaculia bacterium]